MTGASEHGPRPAVPKSVTIADSFARDGLQALLRDPSMSTLTTHEKVSVIRDLDRSGVPEIEITGFVHPKVIPSLADAEAVADAVLAFAPRAVIRALVPNRRGAERAIAAGVPKLSALVVASETYQRLNSNMSIEENLDQIGQIVDLAGDKTDVAVAIGTAFVCPYEGIVPQGAVLEIVEQVVNLGVTEVKLGDSIGLAWPAMVRDRCRAVVDRWPRIDLGLHLHNLAGLALACAFSSYEVGVTRFDGVVGGLGGGIAMPVPASRMANVSTEDLVYLFESSGVDTGIDAANIVAVSQRVRALTGRGNTHVGDFGSLAAFLRMNRTRLDTMREHPPGKSDSSV